MSAYKFHSLSTFGLICGSDFNLAKDCFAASRSFSAVKDRPSATYASSGRDNCPLPIPRLMAVTASG